jgi:hypothetical protein
VGVGVVPHLTLLCNVHALHLASVYFLMD